MIQTSAMFRSDLKTVSQPYTPFLLFAVSFFFFHIGDSIMSYIAPVTLEKYTNSTAMMGIILSTSSMIGVCCDLLFAKYFPNQGSKFFFKLFFSLVFLFPLSFLFFPMAPGFLIGMAVWGIYFEAMVFSKYRLVEESVHHEDHAWAWGILNILTNLGSVVGPILAGIFYDMDERWPYWVAIVSFLFGAYWYITVKFSQRKKEHHRVVTEDSHKHSFVEQLKIWEVYGKVLWPLLILIFIFYMIESSFFSIGPLFAEELQGLHPLGGMFVSIYSMPGLLAGLFMKKFVGRLGKKRTAFVSGLFAGLGLIIMSTFTQVIPILLFTFLASFGLGVLFVAMSATIQDYIGRSAHYANHLIGLYSIFGSLGYILGPLSNGFLAEYLGVQGVFRLWGFVLAGWSTFLFFIVKRKIRMPQHELAQFH